MMEEWKKLKKKRNKKESKMKTMMKMVAQLRINSIWIK